MSRLILTLITVSLVALTTGCRMCAHPYDYCGPMCHGGCDGHCGSDARAGSILSGMTQPLVNAEPVVDSEMEPQAQISSNAPPDFDFGVDPKMIISVTDKKVEDVQQDTPQDSPQVAEDPPSRPSGWKARPRVASRDQDVAAQRQAQ